MHFRFLALTDYASQHCGERWDRRTSGKETKDSEEGHGTKYRFSIGSALLTSFTEIDRFPVLKSEVAKPDRT
jgi:hypothetical protein